MNSFASYAEILLDKGVKKTLDYGLTPEHLESVRIGTRVEVPVRNTFKKGYVTAVKTVSNFANIRPITKVLSKDEIVTPDLFELANWMAQYYCSSLQQVLKHMVPASIRRTTKPKEQLFVMRAKTREHIANILPDLRKKSPAQAEVLDVMLQVTKGILLTELLEQSETSRSPVDQLVKQGILTVDIVRIDRSPLLNEDYFPTKPKQLNAEQAEALHKVTTSLEEQRYETHLLFGITGSGKTEVYLQAISKALELKKGTIMLVPEISLTGQTIERFRSRFEGHIAVLHHRLSHGERADEWDRIRQSKASIVIGARSAIFSPVPNLGLIIVDEEHEHSYKQTEEMPCYHARDLAVMRGHFNQATVLLGSATPSLESFYNAQIGKYTLSKLTARPEASALPKITLVDMNCEYERAKGYTNFSEQLLDGIKKRKEKGEQSILFLNRRGFHTSLCCSQCSAAIKCNHCDLSLTYHKANDKLSCHLCDYSVTPPPKYCPSCKGPTMKFKGAGTEQIERSLHAIFEDIRTLRIDGDTTKHKGSHQKLLREFSCGKADVLIGTQMIAKGLHFPEVTLVGVLNADAPLHIPDFRASESVFQLLTQVAGRAGRGVTAGEVIIQSAMPDNQVIALAVKQEYETFFQEELEVRKLFGYPPFTRMAKLVFSGEDENKTKQYALQAHARLSSELDQEFMIHPVVPAGHAKVKDLFRFQFLIRGKKVHLLVKTLTALKATMELPANIRLQIDVDPLSTFF